MKLALWVIKAVDKYRAIIDIKTANVVRMCFPDSVSCFKIAEECTWLAAVVAAAEIKTK